jgi:hypothetical protein
MSQDYIPLFVQMKVYATPFLLSIDFAKSISFVTCCNNFLDKSSQKHVKADDTKLKNLLTSLLRAIPEQDGS